MEFGGPNILTSEGILWGGWGVFLNTPFPRYLRFDELCLSIGDRQVGVPNWSPLVFAQDPFFF